MQVLTIAGTVGKDAVLRSTNSGDQVLGFSVAVNNGKDRDATWYDCSIWGKRAEILEAHVKKGTKLALTGRPTVRVHDGKAYLGLSVNDLTFQGGKSEQSDEGFRGEGASSVSGRGGGGGHQEQGRGGHSQEGYDLSDDIPFIRMAGEGEA